MAVVPKTLGTKLETVSFSSYRQYTDCGECWYYQRVAEVDVPERPAAWLVAGQAYHAAIEEWENGARVGDIVALFDKHWDLELMGYIEAQPDFAMWELTPRVKTVQRDLDLRLAKGRLWAANYAVRADNERQEWQVLESEVGFEIDCNGILVRGHIDQLRLWNGQHVVVDLKSGSADNTDPRQLGLYAWGIKKKLNLDVAFGRMFYSKYDRVPKSGDQMGRYSDWIDVTRYDDEYWGNQFETMARGVEQGIFLANHTQRCVERGDYKGIHSSVTGSK